MEYKLSENLYWKLWQWYVIAYLLDTNILTFKLMDHALTHMMAGLPPINLGTQRQENAIDIPLAKALATSVPRSLDGRPTTMSAKARSTGSQPQSYMNLTCLIQITLKCALCLNVSKDSKSISIIILSDRQRPKLSYHRSCCRHHSLSSTILCHSNIIVLVV